MAGVSGPIRRPSPGSPLNGLNYSETDSRHTKASGQGWESVDGNSGTMDEHTWEKSGSFPDGPGAWRQT